MSEMENRETGKNWGAPVGLIIASMLGVAVWLVFILIYALAWSKGYSLFQNFIVTIVSLALVCLLIGVMWVAFMPKKYWNWNS